MTLFVRMGIVLSLFQPARRRRDNHFVALAFRQREQLISIISSVRKELICQEAFNQVTRGDNVIYIARCEMDAQGIAQCINDSVDFGG